MLSGKILTDNINTAGLGKMPDFPIELTFLKMEKDMASNTFFLQKILGE